MTDCTNSELHRVIRAMARCFPRQWKPWSEMADEGLRMKGERWPFRPWERLLRWEDVKEIHALMLDCGTMHVLALDFLRSNGKWFRIDEITTGWNEVVASLPEQFHGFDLEAYRRMNAATAADSAVCWRRSQE